MLLGDLSYDEVESYADAPVFFPVGSVEQHGRHAPLSTDSVIAEALARKASERLGFLCLPTLEIGLSQEHRNFGGALYVGASTYRSFLRDALSSLEEFGVDAVVFVNGHGGNIDALREVSRGASRETTLFATEWTWWRVVDRSMGHAGLLETSLLLHLEEHLVDLDMVDGWEESWGEFVESASVSHDVDEFASSGVVGNPNEASREIGREVFEKSVSSLVTLGEWIHENRC